MRREERDALCVLDSYSIWFRELCFAELDSGRLSAIASHSIGMNARRLVLCFVVSRFVRCKSGLIVFAIVIVEKHTHAHARTFKNKRESQ